MLNTYNYESYEEYVQQQTEANKKKLHWEFPKRDHVQWIKTYKLSAKNIICHGTRSGGEQKAFKHWWPEAYVIGTEISETASQFEMTVQHDFAIQKDEWIGKFDILYSNSFDHSINPDKTIQTWKRQMSLEGLMFIEWSEKHNSKSDSWDPVSGTKEQFASFLNFHNINLQEYHPNYHIWVCKA